MKKIIREEGRDARNLLYWTVPPVPQDKTANGIYGRSKSETRLVSDGLLRGRTPRQREWVRTEFFERFRLFLMGFIIYLTWRVKMMLITRIHNDNFFLNFLYIYPTTFNWKLYFVLIRIFSFWFTKKFIRTPEKSIRTLDQRRHDIRARNWGTLFENLRLAVDKIYSTCEQDQAIRRRFS